MYTEVRYLFKGELQARVFELQEPLHSFVLEK